MRGGFGTLGKSWVFAGLRAWIGGWVGRRESLFLRREGGGGGGGGGVGGGGGGGEGGVFFGEGGGGGGKGVGGLIGREEDRKVGR